VLALTIILTLLLSYTAGLVNLATANPVWATDWPWEPIMTPPSIIVSSPIQNATYNSTNVSLNFTVTKPDNWFGPDRGNYTVEYVFGKIKSVYYAVDSGKNKSITVDEGDLFYSTIPAQRAFSFSFSLNLTSGQHKVTIGVKADTYYIVNPFSSSPASVVVWGNSDPVIFTVNLLKPVIVAPENIVYNESSVPLEFTLDTSVSSWVGYSLDGKDNATIQGNTTLTGLSNGEHNVTVYANDTFGNIGASQPVNFTVALPPEMKSFPTATVAAVSGASAVVVVAALLVYFKKRRPKLSTLSKGK
jgi:hypothetical protein